MNQDVYIIAEAGNVHDGSLGNAKKLIELASQCGADCIKFQTHIAGAETVKNAPMPPYFKGEPRYEYFERTGFSLEQWHQLKQHADSLRIGFLSSPFSEAAVDLLEEVGVSMYKIPSGEVTNLPMLKKIGATGKKVFLSSGMSNWDELDGAVKTLRQFHEDIVVMQCTTAYPTPAERVGLNVMAEMWARWGLPVGFSDHTAENYACYAAVCQGACAVEKHITFSKHMYGSDAMNSCEPEQFTDLVAGIRQISTMLRAHVDKNDVGEYMEMKKVFEKSVVSAMDIPKGKVIEPHMLAIKKPGTGIAPARMEKVVGCVAVNHIPEDTVIQDDQIEQPVAVRDK